MAVGKKVMTVILSFFAALRAGDLWAKVTMIMLTAGLFMVFAAYQVSRIRAGGAAAEQSRIERANRANEDKSDAAERAFKACPMDKWNWGAGRCEP